MRVENTTDHPFDINTFPTGTGPNGTALGVKTFNVPRVTVDEKGRHPGVCDIPDDLLADLLAKDPWTKGCFDSGDLVAISGSASLLPASERAIGAMKTSLDTVGTNTTESKTTFKGGK